MFPSMIYRLGVTGDMRDLPGIPWGTSVQSDRGAPSVIHTSLTGRRVKDILGPVRRSWQFAWEFLLIPELEDIQAILEGELGFPLLLEEPFDAPGAIEVVSEDFSRSFVSPTEASVSFTLHEV